MRASCPARWLVRRVSRSVPWSYVVSGSAGSHVISLSPKKSGKVVKGRWEVGRSPECEALQVRNGMIANE
jgi:hypothetical protein